MSNQGLTTCGVILCVEAGLLYWLVPVLWPVSALLLLTALWFLLRRG